jgi:hypothetical protein
MSKLSEALDTAIKTLSHGSSGKNEILGVFVAMKDECDELAAIIGCEMSEVEMLPVGYKPPEL